VGINIGKMKHDPARKGIFVQRNIRSKNSQTYVKPFCVTFPRLANIGVDDSQVIFPSGDFKTFKQAHDFALQVKKIDSRLKNCPVFLLDNRWIKSSATREFQRIG